MPHLNTVLTFLRANSTSQKAKGTHFEKLCVAFLRQDPGMQQQFGKVWLYADWAKENQLSQSDTGIDIVAEVRDGGVCAGQCKFFAEKHAIQKSDIDSFFTASGKHPFTRRLIFDTTTVAWGKHAEDALANQQIDTIRVPLGRIDEAVDWTNFISQDKVSVNAKKTPRPHQVDALKAVEEGLATANRGKVLMACGTGKTYTSLKFAEGIAGAGKWVLYLVPSLSLMSQSIREWTIDAVIPIRARAVCSDTEVGRRKGIKDDMAEFEAQDLDTPATTNPARLASTLKAATPKRMTVVFATYQSIQVVAAAQKEHGLPEFDLIICDEAHRTTGVVFPGDDSRDSNFVKVHDQKFLQGKKRIYMTATPRIYGDAVKTKAGEESVELCSMDDTTIYGETLFERGFGWAVENGLLTDYKVVVLAVDEAMVSAGLQTRLADGDNELKLDDATKIIGCYKALTKQDLTIDVGGDTTPMRRGLAFCRDIASSKLIQNQFAAVVADFLASDEGKENEDGNEKLSCELEHVDGTFAATARTKLLDWLKESPPGEVCRILTNARCLSEGVDVPALDAILFMHPRKSQIDVVQSVGRVMRRAEGKQMGYVILPIGIPAGVAPEDALNDNERYRVVWQILNALRSHDERFDSTINKIDLGEDVSGKIEVIAVSNKLPTLRKSEDRASIGHGSAPDEDSDPGVTPSTAPTQAAFVFDEVSKAIMAKIVKKCGKRDYWETWAVDIAAIAKAHITRITGLVGRVETPERNAFTLFLGELRDGLNDSISEREAIEMLAQHLITLPVFDALFDGYSFAKANPVSIAMQNVLNTLQEHNLAKESDSLQKFYESVKRRAAGITTATGKQRIVVELYEKFFSRAFPKLTERLGIVYTPVEVVDFIIKSVDQVLQSEFGQTLGSNGVHILDPFTGTGTFITRLLQSGLIAPAEIEHKYRHEIHANEIVLLAYYIAAINIEATYHEIVGGDFVPFEGICLTDTFQLYEKDRDLISSLLTDNSNRRTRQKALDIRVIMGNPPYSVGKETDNSDAANVSYPKLDARIQSTYVAHSTGNPRSLYDSYIRAIRWASDRLGDAGVVAYVSNAGWLDGKAADGLRKCLVEEFSSIHVFHLRGNQRTSGERSRREGGKVFGGGSRAPIAITILVKNLRAALRGSIRYHDIGDYLSRAEKLATISRFGSIEGIERQGLWQTIEPDDQGDWLGKKDRGFDKFMSMGDKKNRSTPSLFVNYSNGIKTNRDVWAYNFSRVAVENNMRRMIHFYHECLKDPDRPDINDDRKISWSWVLRSNFRKQRGAEFSAARVRPALYRPFTKTFLYYDNFFNENRYLMPLLFPDGGGDNRLICVSAPGFRMGFSALMTNIVPSLHAADRDGAQCFPRYLYDGTDTDSDATQLELAVSGGRRTKGSRRDAINDEALKHFSSFYPEELITKDDIFYYTYGLLHSEDYRKRYLDNLLKQLPRIPPVKSAADFRAFTTAGRLLADLHCNYEQASPYLVGIAQGDLALTTIADPQAFYRVEQMKYAGKGHRRDKSSVVYNSNITLTGIPLEAYDYVVNGKPALEWVMERQCLSTDKVTGIPNDANQYALEAIGDPAYPLKLFQRVITISLETMKIVRSLPELEFLEVGGEAVVKPVYIQDLSKSIAANWTDTAAADIAIQLICRLSNLEPDKQRDLGLREIVELLGSAELTADIVAALNILVSSEFAILRARAYLYGESGQVEELGAESLDQLLKSSRLLHPRTRQPVKDPDDHVVPVFDLIAELREGCAA